jgi:hypothetical protein
MLGCILLCTQDSSEELDKVESEIKSILEAKLVYLKPALFQQEQAFKAAIPIATDGFAGLQQNEFFSAFISIFPSFLLT